MSARFCDAKVPDRPIFVGGALGFEYATVRQMLAVLQAKQATRQQSRRHHMVTLGRTVPVPGSSSITPCTKSVMSALPSLALIAASGAITP